MIIAVSILGTEITGQVSENNPTPNSTLEELPAVSPAHSTHRLIPSVLDSTSLTGDSNSSFPFNTTSDDVPFLPSGIVSSYRSVQSNQELRSNLEDTSSRRNFTPSYFIGEVIPEPYVPERFQHSISSRSNSSRSYQNPVSSQTALTFQKILPIVEQIKQAALPPIEETPDSVDYHSYLHHVPPVHEPSMEEESTTPKYLANYEDDHRHSYRPNHVPYKFEGGHYNMHSTRPITFEDPQIGQVTHHGNQNKHEEQHHHEKHKGPSDLYDGQEGHYNKGHHEEQIDFSSIGSPSKFQANINYEDYLNAQVHHHHPDFVVPPSFYPHEPDIPNGHLKEVHYKVYKQ